MNARRRKAGNTTLQPNLYRSGDYFRYKHPLTGKFCGMGKDIRQANNAARKLNAILLKETDLTRRVLGLDTYTFQHVLERYKTEYLPTKGNRLSTAKTDGYRLGKLERHLGDVPVADMTVKFISDYLDREHKNDAYIKHRTLLKDIFKWARTKGIVDSNPANQTLTKKPSKKKRQPINLEQFKAIRKIAPLWVQVAMDIAITTLLRRGDVCDLKYSNTRDGKLYVITQKTGDITPRAHLAITVSTSLASILTDSRQDKVASPYVVHVRPKRMRPSKEKKHWSQVLPDRLSKEFKKCRDQTGLFDDLPPKKRPTFHEIRSLGGHLYKKKAGYTMQQIQDLMGHTKVEMTEHYLDPHEEWSYVDAGMDLRRVLD